MITRMCINICNYFRTPWGYAFACCVFKATWGFASVMRLHMKNKMALVKREACAHPAIMPVIGRDMFENASLILTHLGLMCI